MAVILFLVTCEVGLSNATLGTFVGAITTRFSCSTVAVVGTSVSFTTITTYTTEKFLFQQYWGAGQSHRSALLLAR